MIKKSDKNIRFKCLYLHKLGLFVFKFKNKLISANFNNYYKNIKNVHNYHARGLETNIFLPRFNSKISHTSLFYQGSKLLTKLPLCLKDKSLFGKFQDKLKIYLIKTI